MNFERHQSPLKTLRMGRRQKRLFKNVEEAAQWALRFPEEYTEGFVTSWFGKSPHNGEYFFNFSKYKFNSDALNIEDHHGARAFSSDKLQMVKWAKVNIRWEDHPEYVIGLKDCKAIFDRLEEIIMEEYNSSIGEVLEKLKQKYQTNEN